MLHTTHHAFKCNPQRGTPLRTTLLGTIFGITTPHIHIHTSGTRPPLYIAHLAPSGYFIIPLPSFTPIFHCPAYWHPAPVMDPCPCRCPCRNSPS